jgi:hypothetical protein
MTTPVGLSGIIDDQKKVVENQKKVVENLDKVTADRQYELTRSSMDQELRFHCYTRAVNRLATGMSPNQPAPAMEDVLMEAEQVYQWVLKGTVPAKPNVRMN